MTGCDNGWEKLYGPEYHKLSPSEQQHIDKLKQEQVLKREIEFEQELDDYEDWYE
jgi:hypothetical protein